MEIKYTRLEIYQNILEIKYTHEYNFFVLEKRLFIKCFAFLMTGHPTMFIVWFFCECVCDCEL